MGHIEDPALHDNGVWPYPFDMGRDDPVEVRRQEIKQTQIGGGAHASFDNVLFAVREH